MKRLCLVLGGLVALSLVGFGCERTAHDRYRQMNARRVVDADLIGIADDTEAAIFLSDRPTHLTTWYPR